MQLSEAMTQQDVDGIISDIKRKGGETDNSPILSKEQLNQVDVVIRDPQQPISSTNADVYLNGELLKMVKGFKLELDTEKPLARVTLELWATFSVVEKEGTE